MASDANMEKLLKTRPEVVLKTLTETFDEIQIKLEENGIKVSYNQDKLKESLTGLDQKKWKKWNPA